MSLSSLLLLFELSIFYSGRSLRHILQYATRMDSYSFTMLKHLLEKAEENGCIDHRTFVKLRRTAQKRSTKNAVISSNLNNIRELGLESIGRRLQEIESTFIEVCSPSLAELPKDQAVNNVICAILNAYQLPLFMMWKAQ